MDNQEFALLEDAVTALLNRLDRIADALESLTNVARINAIEDAA